MTSKSRYWKVLFLV